MERYWSTTSHGLSANVRSPEKEWLKAVKEWLKAVKEEMKKKQVEIQQLKELKEWLKAVLEWLKERESYWSTDSTGSWDMEEEMKKELEEMKKAVEEMKKAVKEEMKKKQEEEIMKAVKEMKKEREEEKKERKEEKKEMLEIMKAQKEEKKEMLEIMKAQVELMKEITRTRTSDSDESTTSNVSFKSDESKKDIINFRETLSPPRFKKKSSGEEDMDFRLNWPGFSLPMANHWLLFRHGLSANVRSPSEDYSSFSEDEGVEPDDVDH